MFKRFKMRLNEEVLGFAIATVFALYKTDPDTIKEGLKEYNEAHKTSITLDDIETLASDWNHNRQVDSIVANSITKQEKER